jgi:glycosyltransferase involved in cell wall biosynthesis
MIAVKTTSCAHACAACARQGAGACARRALAPLKCLQIGSGWFPEQPGGLERYFFDLVHHLPSAAVTPVGLVTGSELVEYESCGVVRSVALPDAKLWSRLGAMKRSAVERAREGIDLVASHFALYSWSAGRALRDCPWVVHFHGPWADEGLASGGSRAAGYVKHMLEKHAYRRGDRFITLSNAFADLLVSRFGVDREKVTVVPGGVDGDRFDIATPRNKAREMLSWPRSRPIVLSVRRLVPRMGLENLIETAADPALLDVQFMIAGKGPLLPELRRRVAARGLEQRVRLLGYVPDDRLPLMYRAADLSILPSLSLEGFGLTAVESLMAGTPTLVTPIGGLPEVVRGLSPDLVTEDTTPTALAAAIHRWRTGPALPTAAHCRNYARENFDWPVIARKVRDVYAQAMN